MTQEKRPTRSWAVLCCSCIRQKGKACSLRCLRADQPSASQTPHLLCYELMPALSCCLVMCRVEESTRSGVDFIIRRCLRVCTHTQAHTHKFSAKIIK